MIKIKKLQSSDLSQPKTITTAAYMGVCQGMASPGVFPLRGLIVIRLNEIFFLL